MRKQIVAGNWKMNKTESETIQLIDELKQQDLKMASRFLSLQLL